MFEHLPHHYSTIIHTHIHTSTCMYVTKCLTPSSALLYCIYTHTYTHICMHTQKSAEHTKHVSLPYLHTYYISAYIHTYTHIHIHILYAHTQNTCPNHNYIHTTYLRIHTCHLRHKPLPHILIITIQPYIHIHQDTYTHQLSVYIHITYLHESLKMALFFKCIIKSILSTYLRIHTFVFKCISKTILSTYLRIHTCQIQHKPLVHILIITIQRYVHTQTDTHTHTSNQYIHT
jgi:hypothetical protein